MPAGSALTVNPLRAVLLELNSLLAVFCFFAVLCYGHYWYCEDNDMNYFFSTLPTHGGEVVVVIVLVVVGRSGGSFHHRQRRRRTTSPAPCHDKTNGKFYMQLKLPLLPRSFLKLMPLQVQLWLRLQLLLQ